MINLEEMKQGGGGGGDIEKYFPTLKREGDMLPKKSCTRRVISINDSTNLQQEKALSQLTAN